MFDILIGVSMLVAPKRLQWIIGNPYVNQIAFLQESLVRNVILILSKKCLIHIGENEDVIFYQKG